MQDDPGALDPVVDATQVVGAAIRDVDDIFWKLELATHAVLERKPAEKRQGLIGDAVKQAVASLLAMGTLVWLTLRHKGTAPAAARSILGSTDTVFAIHGEDATRTRHLRQALARHEAPAKPIIILGRPDCELETAAARLDPAATIEGARYLRPLDLGSVLRALPQAAGGLLRGIGQTRRYRLPLAMRDRIAMAFRLALGFAHATWWEGAAGGTDIKVAIFAHTGNADSSRLERAMQARGTRTVHAVHGTNIGWAFAGLSDVGVFQTGSDARLARSLPAYARSTHLPVDPPAPGAGNGDWALLTSYTHLMSSAYQESGSRADCRLVQWLSGAARAAGHDPARVLWRPHPQIALVAERERTRLEAAVAQAGFTRWPDDLPYAALGEMSVAVTTPSTVLTDGLRLGQPTIVASVTPLQRDLLYARYPLLAEDEGALAQLIARVLDPQQRSRAFADAWTAIEPGAPPDIARLLAIL